MCYVLVLIILMKFFSAGNCNVIVTKYHQGFQYQSCADTLNSKLSGWLDEGEGKSSTILSLLIRQVALPLVDVGYYGHRYVYANMQKRLVCNINVGVELLTVCFIQRIMKIMEQPPTPLNDWHRCC